MLQNVERSGIKGLLINYPRQQKENKMNYKKFIDVLPIRYIDSLIIIPCIINIIIGIIFNNTIIIYIACAAFMGYESKTIIEGLGVYFNTPRDNLDG